MSIKENAKPFEIGDIEDVRIIIYAKGKYWGIVPDRIVSDVKGAKEFRITLGYVLLQTHKIVDKPLEDISSV